MPAVRISEVREDEGELSETAVQAQAAAKPNRSCTRVDLTSASGAANANVNVGDTLPAGPPAQPELANSLLSKLLDGTADAPVLAAGVVTRYPYLLPNAEIEASLKPGVEQGIPEATLYLGELYLAGVRAPRDPAQALSYLHQAATPPETALKGHYRSEEHTSELQSLMRISYAVFC